MGLLNPWGHSPCAFKAAFSERGGGYALWIGGVENFG